MQEGEKPLLPLGKLQRRALGVLIEKAFSTPESYPLTINAMVAGCKQKSARDPEMPEVQPEQVEAALDDLKRAGLVECIFPATGRTERWRHILKEAWGLDGKQRAIVAELLLRGPQTEGELRGRASRMQEITSLDELTGLMEQLAARGFLRRLSAEGQKRGVLWMHLLYPPEERDKVAERFRQRSAEPQEDEEPAPVAGAPPVPTRSALEERIVVLDGQVNDLRGKLDDLAQAFDHLAAQVKELQRRDG